MNPDPGRIGAGVPAPARSVLASSLTAWTLIAILSLAFALRTIGLDAQSLWRDEVDAIRFASSSLPALLAMFRQQGQNGPLYYLLLRPWLAAAGTSEFSLRYFSTAWGVLAVALTYRLGRRLFPGRRVAVVAALLAAVSAYLAWYAQEGKMYSLVVVLALASAACYAAALQRGGAARWLGYVVFTSAAFYVHLVAAALVPAQALLFLIVPARLRRARWRGWLAAMAALTLPYVPLLAWQVPLLGLGTETGYSPVPAGEMVHSLLASYSLGVLPPTSPWWLLPFVAALVGGVLATAPVLWRGRPGPARLARGLLLGWLIVPVVVFGLVNLVRPMYTARYLIFVLPAFLLLMAAGVGALARQSRLLGAGLLAVLLVLNARGLWVQTRTPLKADFRAATRYVADRLLPGDLVLFQIPYGRYSFEYYLARDRALPSNQAREAAAGHAGGAAPQGGARIFLPLVVHSLSLDWAEGLYTNAGMTPEEVDRRMREQVGEHRVVWLVATEVPLWDERGLVEAWLEEHGELTDRQELVRVAVYRYTVGG